MGANGERMGRWENCAWSVRSTDRGLNRSIRARRASQVLGKLEDGSPPSSFVSGMHYFQGSRSPNVNGLFVNARRERFDSPSVRELDEIGRERDSDWTLYPTCPRASNFVVKDRLPVWQFETFNRRWKVARIWAVRCLFSEIALPRIGVPRMKKACLGLIRRRGRERKKVEESPWKRCNVNCSDNWTLIQENCIIFAKYFNANGRISALRAYSPICPST